VRIDSRFPLENPFRDSVIRLPFFRLIKMEFYSADKIRKEIMKEGKEVKEKEMTMSLKR
jgi:hypothetical protein